MFSLFSSLLRLAELEKTNNNYKYALQEVEKLKMELSTLPEHVVVETTEHKCLQSQFSVLYNEAMQLKTQLEEARNQLQVRTYSYVDHHHSQVAGRRI